MNAFRSLVRPWIRLWRMLPLLDRWLVGELIGPLLFGIGSFTAVSVSVGAVFELVRRIAESGLPLDVAAQVLVLQVPGFVVLSFPMSTLMSTLLTYGKLSSNSELTALRSVGVPTWRMVIPAMALALLMTLITFSFNEAVVPQTLRASEAMLNRAIGRAVAGEERKDVEFSNFGEIERSDGSSRKALTQYFYAKKFEDGEMKKITMLDLSRDNQRLLLTAERGRWIEREGKWEFLEGKVYVVPEDPNSPTTVANFDRYLYPLGAELLKRAELPKDSNTLTIGQARTAERLLREAGDDDAARKMSVRIQEKFAFPAVCLVFGMVGSSIGVRPHSRQSRSQGFGVSVVLIFSYYVVAFVFSSLGVKGVLPPYVTAWTPVLLGLTAAGLLLRQASR